MRYSLKNVLLPFAIGLLIFVTGVTAQMSSNSSTLLLAMAANAKRMMQYEWKQRITVVRKGNAAEPIIDQVRFDSAGKMQRTTISAPEQKEARGLRGRVKSNVAAGVKEDVKQIMELAGSYNKPQQMVEAVRKAQVSQTGGGTIRLQANNLITSTDSMTMMVNSATHLAKHVDIKTDYNGDPMAIAQDYSPVPGGPNVMKTMRVSVPAKSLVVNVDSYDFVRQTAALRR